MIRVIVGPAKRRLRRPQWQWEIRASNGKRIDPRDTYNNRLEAVGIMEKLVAGSEPVELVVKDRHGSIEDRRWLR